MLAKLVTTLYAVVGLINFAPVVGVLSSGKLASLYGVPIAGSDLSILLRHRALLFGVIGGYVLYSVFKSEVRPTASLLAMVSMVGFILLAVLEGQYNPQISRVIIADVIALIALSVAWSISYHLNNAN